jgi:hypothetical protein
MPVFEQFNSLEKEKEQEKIEDLARKVLAVENELTPAEIKERFKIKADKVEEFNTLDENYKINMLSRYQVFEELDENERAWVKEHTGESSFLDNLWQMYETADEYVAETFVTKPKQAAQAA